MDGSSSVASGPRHQTGESVTRVEAVQIDYFDVPSFYRELCQSRVHAFAEEQEFGVRGVGAQRCPRSLES